MPSSGTFLTVGYGGREAVEDGGVIADAETTAGHQTTRLSRYADGRQVPFCKTQPLAARDVAMPHRPATPVREKSASAAKRVGRRAALTKRENARVWRAVGQGPTCAARAVVVDSKAVVGNH